MKQDFSNICDLDDENMNNDCWNCERFLFPIGCMVGIDGEDEEIHPDDD